MSLQEYIANINQMLENAKKEVIETSETGR